MKLSVIIPCFNEINTIEQIISKVQNFNDLEKEIIVIDDCSNDGTKEILNSEISNSIDKLITNDANETTVNTVVFVCKTHLYD